MSVRLFVPFSCFLCTLRDDCFVGLSALASSEICKRVVWISKLALAWTASDASRTQR